MAKRDIVQLECDFCGANDTIDIRESGDKVLPIISKWSGVISGDEPPAQGADGHRWYDTLECLISGERKYASDKAIAAKEALERNAALERASASLRKSGFMDKAVQVAKA